MTDPLGLDLSAGSCVGDLRFTDRPNKAQVAICGACPVRAICPQPSTLDLDDEAPSNPCAIHTSPNLRCSTCREYVHTYDHQPDWVVYGGKRRCLICHRRANRRNKAIETTRVPWTEVVATLDRFNMGDRYSWGLIVADLGTTPEALHRRLTRRGMRNLADQLLTSREWKRAA